MKKLIAVFALTTSFCLAADWTGYIVDQNCASKKEMLGNVACAKSCIARGAKAVLATEDGTIYKIADQDKVKAEAGKKVTITGTMEGDSIKIDSIKAM
jgi:predicted transcriptional regulator